MALKKFKLNLRLFDGAAAPSATGTAQPTGDTNPSDAGKKQGATPKVVYGIQDTQETTPPEETTQAAAEEQDTTTPDTAEAKKATFEAMIQGEYKDYFAERTQSIIDKRFKDTKILEKQLGDTKPILELLGPKYGITDGDLSKLAKAIQEDTSLYEAEAMEKGMTVEQLQYQKKIEKENAELKTSQQEIERKRIAQETMAQWTQQADALKNIYPNFDFQNEINNPQTGEGFKRMLRSGVDVKTAYQALHFDEILPSAMHTTAEKAREQTVNNIKSRSTRPSENGISSQTGVIVKNDVSKLTAADRKEIAKRVARGEIISF